MTRHVKNLALVGALILTVVAAGASVDSRGAIRQLFYATDPTSMAAEPNVVRGNAVVVGSASASQNVFFGFPATRTADNVHVYNGQNGVQWVDLYTLTGGANIDKLLGATLITYQDEEYRLPNSAQFGLQDGDPNSAVVVDKVGTAVWSVSAPFGTTSTTYCRGDDTRVVNAVQTSRTITATSPLRIDGGSSANLGANRTISISPGNNYQVLTTSGSGVVEWSPIYDANVTSVGWNKILNKPTDLVYGTGSSGYISKFSGANTVANSKLFEDADGIALGHTNAEDALDIRGNLGNTCVTLYDTNTTNAHWVLCSSMPSAGNGLFYLNNPTSSKIPFAVKHSGEVGINTTDPTTALDVNGTLRVRGGSPGAGKIMISDVNGVCSWWSLGELGIFKNGDDLAYLSDHFRISATGINEIYGALVGYSASKATGSGYDVNIRAQSTNDDSAGQRGGYVNIYAGSAPLTGSATQGEIVLTTGRGIGETYIVGKTTKHTRSSNAGWIAIKSPSIEVYEEQQWSSVTTSGNATGTIWFNSWDGTSGIPNDTYRLEFDVIATRIDDGAGALAAKLIATVVKQAGSITQTVLRTVYKDSELYFEWSSPASDAVALLFHQTGSAAYNHKWIFKASIIREP